MGSVKLLVHSARQIVLVVKNHETVVIKEEMQSVATLDADDSNGIGNGLSLVIDQNGLICAIGTDTEIKEKYQHAEFERKIDATGKCVLPGLIDGHTHPVWVGDRVHEFAMKLEGATYMDVHKAGGGINYTVEKVRQASEDELYQPFKTFLKRMLHSGTTVVECKSGYGLELESEIKMLRVIERGKRELDMEISSTYCGAHSVPKGSTAEEATEDIINNQIPKLKQLMDSEELHVDNIDVFCEKGVFEVEQSRRILQAGKTIGLAINFHGDELYPLKGAEMGAALDARAISHLEEVSHEGMAAMAKAGTVAVILPTTAYILRLKPPPVREMIDMGVPVALGTDFNPNAHCLSMPLVMHLACVNLKMTMAEALMAATINAAASLGISKTHGSLENGKVGDLLVINAPRWEHLIYQLGGHDHLIHHVIKRGKVVYTNPNM